jgi:hypothetical protein
MSTFALIASGLVADISPTEFPVVSQWAWVDVTTVTPPPQAGWSAVETSGAWAFVPPAAPILTPAQQAAAAMAAGLTVASASDAAMNATYPTDVATQQKVSSIEVRLAAGLGFPGGGTTMPWKDSSGAWHALTAAQFTALAGAISVFVAACDLLADGYPGAALPPSSVTIA